MTGTTPAQLYCALIPLRGDALLLPNAAVAEALSQDALQADDVPVAGRAGRVLWGGQHIPVLHFESLNGGEAGERPRRARLVVLHPLTAGCSPVAVLSQGYPHLVALSRAAVQSLPLRATDHPDRVLARVRIGNTEALIPNLETVQALVRPA